MNNSLKPRRLSILLAVHNEEQHLAQAIQSVLDQTLEHFELVLVDDRSTDTTRSIADGFATRDSRVRVFANDGAGKVDAYNMAFRESMGDAFCFFAGDDYLPSESLQLRLEALPNDASRPSISICGYETVSEDARFDGNERIPQPGVTISLWSGAIIVFNRPFAERIFPLPSHLPSEDLLAYYVALFGEARISNVPRALYKYRIHDGNSYGHSAKHHEMKRRFDLDPEILETVQDRLFAEGEPPAALRDRIVCSRRSVQGKTVRCLLSRNVPLRDRLRYAWRSDPRIYDGVKLLMSQFGHK